MIVVDSSVWIELLRGHDGEHVQRLTTLAATTRGQILVGDIVLLEVLRGARNDDEAAVIEQMLSRFQMVRMVGPTLARQAASAYRLLRQRGITVAKTMDLIIGSYCVATGHTLLARDRDFEPMIVHLGLQMVL